ncbi:MAG TPA: LysR family transcriptional regulator [Thauera sp.]|uniref:LysR family transcriptional regulator n=1 Tax=Thauera sp. TaxID=1905334 RepID=UPI002B828A47|nr:LysR family transcriptional regulator [Thauera sp.]HRP25043.1 LysR family transcriptional regulator [Thauera sp.]HRP65798.1 LysR family transcriptional regulator [Thauera sp.]
MRLTLHQLRLLLAVSREGGVTRAAQRLHLTQPTLSAQLRQLSEQVGLALFERVGRRLHLTAAGEAVVASAQRVEHELEALDETLAGLRGDLAGRLRLAVVSTAETFIPRLLGDFRRERPAVEVSLVVLNRDAVIRRLADNLDDLYIMSRPPEAPVVVATPFLNNPLVVIAPADHALAGRSALPVAALAEEEFVLREPGSGTRQATEHFFAEHGLTLRPRLELGSNEAVRQAVAGGLGLSVLSAHALAHAADEGIAVLSVVDTPVYSQWQVVYPGGKRLSPLAAAFLGFLQTRAPELNRTAQARLSAARR